MGLLSNCLACCGQLVKILITLKPYGIIGSNCAYFFNFNIVQPLVWKKTVASVSGASFGQSRYFSKNAHNSWTVWYILIKFCILTHCNIIETHVYNKVIRVCQEFLWQSQVIVLHTCVLIMLNCTQKSKCSIFHNIFKYMIFQKAAKGTIMG